MNPSFQTVPLGEPPMFDVNEAVHGREKKLDNTLRSAFLAHDSATDNLDRLFAAGSLCVTTGQQPGVLTGPLFTLYKGLTAVALAQSLERILGRPVVPVFWVAGDDHDFAEINHCHMVTVSNEVERLVLRDRAPDAHLVPAYRERLGDEIDTVIGKIAETTPETEYKSDVLAWVREHYRPDADVATAFAQAVSVLLGRFGLVVFQPTHPAAKGVMAPWLVRALEQAGAIETALAQQAAQLEAAGRPTPIRTGGGATTVMIEASLGRDRLIYNGASFETRRSGEQWSLAELRTIAATEPQRLSANVLLRPVVEAAILPTVAYVGGPGEVAYLPQSDPAYRILGVRPQARVARWAGRVVEQRIAKVLNKYGIAAEQLDAPEGQLEATLVQADMPTAAAAAVETLRSTLSSQYERLAEAAASLDATLERPVRSEGQAALRRLTAIEKRLVGQLKKRNEVLNQQLAKARANLFPLGQAQERVLNVVPFLIRYGDAFVDGISERCTEWTAALETASGQT
jgi:bacillithiol biosynthesis cysteine-adding enzyme BshC